MSALIALVLGQLLSSAGAMAQSAPARTHGQLQLAGRTMSCSGVSTQLDAALPNYGTAVPDRRLLIINPRLVAQQPDVVQWFVFAHECGHHHVGGNEMVADCWATNRGVAEGWLDKSGLTHICRSFGGGPATETHPAARSRCSNLDRCFERAFTQNRGQQPSRSLAAVTPPLPSDRVDGVTDGATASAYAPALEHREDAARPTQSE
jgi:hypothetical protein